MKNLNLNRTSKISPNVLTPQPHMSVLLDIKLDNKRSVHIYKKSISNIPAYVVDVLLYATVCLHTR